MQTRATISTGIIVHENEITQAAYVQIKLPSSTRVVAYRVSRSLGGDDWTVRDPSGGAICRAATRERALEVARELAECARERAGEDDLAC
jgi:hypothetical protein